MNILKNTLKKYWMVLFVIVAFAGAVTLLQLTPFSIAASSNGGNFVFVANVLQAWGGGDGCCGGDRGGDPGGGRDPDFNPPIVYNPKPSCSISANPSSIQSGVSPDVTKTYKLTVTGPGGTANCKTTITVQEQQPPSCTISADPSSVQYGGSSTLTWNSTNATSASINQGIGSVALNGSNVVSSLLNTRAYTMTVTGP